MAPILSLRALLQRWFGSPDCELKALPPLDLTPCEQTAECLALAPHCDWAEATDSLDDMHAYFEREKQAKRGECTDAMDVAFTVEA